MAIKSLFSLVKLMFKFLVVQLLNTIENIIKVQKKWGKAKKMKL